MEEKIADNKIIEVKKQLVMIPLEEVWLGIKMFNLKTSLW